MYQAVTGDGAATAAVENARLARTASANARILTSASPSRLARLGPRRAPRQPLSRAGPARARPTRSPRARARAARRGATVRPLPRVRALRSAPAGPAPLAP